MEVFFSARLEEACAALAEQVRVSRLERGPLDPVVLWVPSGTVGTFARMRLAEALGVAARVETSSVLDGLAGLAEALDPPLTLLDRPRLRGRVLALLHDEAALADPVFAPLRAWLAGAGGARRRSELAAVLSRTFEQYLLGRARWLAAERAALSRGALADAGARWQLALLSRVLDGSAARPLAEALPRWGTAELPAVIHVLGWSILPLAVVDALEALGRRTRVVLYAPNPSRALWADRDVDRAELSLLLTHAGRAHRELVSTINERTGQDAGDLPTPRDAPRTLLEHAQRCLDEAADAPWTGGPDDSIAVVACPGIRREAEQVAQSIWRRVHERGGALSFERIAVYYVDRDDQPYAAHIDAVFAEAHHIPRRIAGQKLSSVSPVVGAVRALLRVPLTERTRPDVLGVLTHPLVRGRWADIDGEEWLSWCAAVGVVRGTDAADLAEEYLEGESSLHWDQGLARLALGTVTDRERVSVGARGPLLPEPVEGTRARAAGRLVLLARSLLEDARWLTGAELTIDEWVRALGELVATYVAPTDDAHRAALRACLAAIARVSAVDAGAARVGYRAAHDLVVEAIDALTAPAGSPLSGGVHVAPLGVGKVVPFDVVFVMGLDARHFPAREAAGDLDLRPRAADGLDRLGRTELLLDAPRDDADRTAFLEVLLSARQGLVLSWTARDAVTGEAQAPSPLVSQLLRWAEVGARAPITVEERPLWRAADAARAPVIARAVPAIAAEHRAAALGDRYAEAAQRPREAIALDRALAQVAPDHRDGLEDELRVVPLPAPPRGEAPRETDIRVSQLRQYLECPLQGSARFALRLVEDDEDDRLALEAEPLSSDRRLRGQEVREAFVVGAPGGPSRVERELVERARRRRARAEAPQGRFGRAEGDADRRAVAAWAQALAGTALAPLALGQPRAGGGPARVVSPLALETSRGRVRLVGETSLLAEAPSRTVILRYPMGSKRADLSWPMVVRAVVDHAILTVLDGAPRPHGLRVLAVDGLGTVAESTRSWAALSVDEARAFLALTAEAMLGPPADYLFPVEVAANYRERRSVAEVVDAAREDLLGEYPSVSSRFGPIRDPQEYRSPQPAEVEAVMARLALVFECVPELTRPKGR